MNVCYLPASGDALDTYTLDTRPLYVLPALTLHEAVPGHPLQGALAREITRVSTFRLYSE